MFEALPSTPPPPLCTIRRLVSVPIHQPSIHHMPPRGFSLTTRRRLYLSIAVFAAAAPLRPTAAQPAQRAILRDKFERDLRHAADAYDGVLGVATIDLTDSTTLGVNDTLVFPQGSAIKVPILIELFRRAEHEPGLLRARQTMTAAARTGGSGVLGFFSDSGSALSNEDLAVLMISLSDNSATNMLIDLLGMDPVNRTLASMGFARTKLQRKMIRTAEMVRGQENVSTPTEAAAIMARVARCQLPMSAASCARVRTMLELPKDEPVRSAVPPNVRVASKPGSVTGVATSWAFVELPGRPFVLTVMTNYGDTDRGNDVIREIARLALDYYGKLAGATPYGARVPVSP